MVVEASFERFAGFFVMRLLNEDRVTTATAVSEEKSLLRNNGPKRRKTTREAELMQTLFVLHISTGKSVESAQFSACKRCQLLNQAGRTRLRRLGRTRIVGRRTFASRGLPSRYNRHDECSLD